MLSHVTGWVNTKHKKEKRKKIYNLKCMTLVNQYL